MVIFNSYVSLPEGNVIDYMNGRNILKLCSRIMRLQVRRIDGSFHIVSGLVGITRLTLLITGYIPLKITEMTYWFSREWGELSNP